jgi:type 1 fimbriae regulatory protein FimB/type 1 fimbriae regulatory protein FimE
MPTIKNGTVAQVTAAQPVPQTITGDSVAPQNRPLPPKRLTNAERRPREHLTPAEVDILRHTAKTRDGRYGERDALAILVMYRHGLRVIELCRLTHPQVDFKEGVLHVNRVKNGRPSTHPLGGQEIRELKKLLREWPDGRFVFQNERGGPLTPAGFRKTLARIGTASPLGFPVHPHMLRHACGYYLANKGIDTRTLQQFLGHRSIVHTVGYTELDADRFNGFWPD